MIKKSNVTRKDISKAIHKRINLSLKESQIHDVCSIIYEFLIEEIRNDRAVSVHNFGTFSPYLFHGHLARDVVTGQLIHTLPFRTLKFRPHVVLTALLEQRRSDFQVTAETTKRRSK